VHLNDFSDKKLAPIFVQESLLMGDYQVPRTEIQPVTRLVHEYVHQVRLPFECLAYHLRILSRIDAVSRSLLLG